MKVLFVSSGNSNSGISPIVYCQGESLKKNLSVEIKYYTIKGKGFKGYLNNIIPLKKYLKNNNFDVIHAHYSLSAFVASLAGANPLIISLMGSDVKSKGLIKVFIYVFKLIFRWKQLIVKSEDMKKNLGIKNTVIIPNGVDFELFIPKEKNISQAKLKWKSSNKHILFAANPNRFEKNFKLANQALSIINDPTIEIHFLENVPHDEISIWMNAADVILLTSLWEGSPNVIKESMACNRPVVSTMVGDISWLFGDEPGHFISTFEPINLAESISLALNYAQNHLNTNGRDRLAMLGLKSEDIAKRIIGIYQKEILANEIN